MDMNVPELEADLAELTLKMQSIVDRTDAENRDMRPDETREFRRLSDKATLRRKQMDVAERQTRERSDAIRRARLATLPAGAHIEQPGDASVARRTITHTRSGEELVYRPDANASYFADLVKASLDNDITSRDRLERHRRQVAEQRDLSSTDGVGGDFVFPLYLADEWLPLSRAGRPFANAIQNLPLPPYTDVLTLPRLVTGSATSAQADLGAVSETDPTTGSLSVPVKTQAGQVDVARQLLDRGQPGTDQWIFADLIADLNTKIDLQCLVGSGSGANVKGVLSDSNRVQITYTDASPTVAEFYSKVQDAAQRIATARFLPADLLVLHPRRWAWILASADTTGRPLVSPTAGGQNAVGTSQMTAQGPAGTFGGLRVIVDANLPINLGSGTNEDVAIVTRSADHYLWEPGPPQTRVHDSVLSGNLAVRLQVWNYLAYSSERYSAATVTIGGSGMAAVAF
jgi:HK97 family phage major capsid protein